MLFFSKPLFIIPLVIFFIGISLIPMADSLLRAERYGDFNLSEEEKEESFQRCLNEIPTSVTVLERIVAEDECEHILTQYFTGSRATNTIIDDHLTFVKTCTEFHDIFEFVGEEVALNTYSHPKLLLCLKLYNAEIWKYDKEDRIMILANWYNQNALTSRDIIEQREREFLFGSISTLKEEFEEEKTIQMDIKPASPEEDDKFDFKPEKTSRIEYRRRKRKILLSFLVLVIKSQSDLAKLKKEK